MQNKAIFSEHHDYLLIALAAGLVCWCFYGLTVAIGALVIVVAAANLQPFRRAGFSKMASALLAFALVLILSVWTKLFDKEGYCYALFGPGRELADSLGILKPCFPGEDFYGDTGQKGGLGYVRDFGLPLAGLIVGLAVLRALRSANVGPSSKVLGIVAAVLALLVIAPPVIHVSGIGDIIDPASTDRSREMMRDIEEAVEDLED